MAYSKDNVFFWWPDKDGKSPQPGQAQCDLVKWIIDYSSSKLVLSEPEMLINDDMEFPRVDERIAFEKHSHTFFCVMDHKAGTDMAFIGPVLGGECRGGLDGERLLTRRLQAGILYSTVSATTTLRRTSTPTSSRGRGS